MHVLIVGSLAGELGNAASIARSRGATLAHTDTVMEALAYARKAGSLKLALCEVTQDIGCFVAALRAERILLPVVACGLEHDEDAAAQAIRAGAQDYLPLPPDPLLLAAYLQAAADDEDTVVSSSEAMTSVLQRASQIARSDASVMITGESGTGKERLARYIHAHSARAAGPFVALNCAALPEQLIESELFGHEKGAFSGAAARRNGKFEAANNGTLLLDEVTEMDVRLQAKLLRAIQEREIDRLGGTSPVRVNVRILATTNRDIEAEISSGRFREDLYFRINVVTLTVPPLRERREDIVPLSNYFLARYSQINGFSSRYFSDSARDSLARYSWRGNVRELENVVHRALLLSDQDVIGEESLDLPLEKHALAERVCETISAPAGGGMPWVGSTVSTVEQALILDTLHHTYGNRTQAALILGISIRSLRNKLRDYASQGLHVPPPHVGGGT